MTVDSSETRRARLLATLRLQYPDTVADRGFRLLHPATGEQYTDEKRHLVATCRSIVNFSLGINADAPHWCADGARHGLQFLRESHRVDAGAGYHLVVDDEGTPRDETRAAYAHAFVLLAYAKATDAGIDEVGSDLERTAELIDERFVESNGLLCSDFGPDWSDQEQYRGLNANMHACEAYLAAYEATAEERYLDRARTIAYRLTVGLASTTDGLLWEHYTPEWEHDFEYNEDDPRHQFRPPGYQPGHHIEWAKIIGLLDRYDDTDSEMMPTDGWYDRGVELFDTAIDLGWTERGFAYTVDGDGEILVPDRYGWALAEAVGASAALFERASANDDSDAADRFRKWEERLVGLADQFRGPAGLWYEKRTAVEDGDDPVAPDPPGVEPDYHPANAWYESWHSFRRVNE